MKVFSLLIPPAMNQEGIFDEAQLLLVETIFLSIPRPITQKIESAY